jgi:glycosyltransferase involved in cell wall biosynthesis
LNKEFLVSIIIPFRNRISLVERAVESVIHQTYKLWEIILVDDFSSEPIRPSLISDYRIKLIQNGSNLGPSSSRQKGITFARGQYLCFLDSDDSYHPHFLEMMLKEHRLNPKLTFAYCTSVWVDNMNHVLHYYKKSNLTYYSIMPYLLLDSRPWNTSSIMWNRAYIAHWHENLRTWEDYLFEFQSSILNNSITHVRETLCYIYKDENEGLSMDIDSLISFSHRIFALHIMLKHPNNDNNIQLNIISRLKKEVAKLARLDQNSITFRRVFLLLRPYSIYCRFLNRNQHWFYFKKILKINIANKIYLKINFNLNNSDIF